MKNCPRWWARRGLGSACLWRDFANMGCLRPTKIAFSSSKKTNSLITSLRSPRAAKAPTRAARYFFSRLSSVGQQALPSHRNFPASTIALAIFRCLRAGLQPNVASLYQCAIAPERRTTTVNPFEQLINTGDCFTQVSLYQLLREDGRVFIFVHKILAGAAPSWPPQRRICWYWKITRRSPQRLPCKNQRGTHQRQGRRSIAVSTSSMTCRYDSNHCRHRQYQSRQQLSIPV